MLDRAARARLALEGLSVGDAFGERFFGDPEHEDERIEKRVLPEPVWGWTDDTAMALSLVEHLEEHGEVVRGQLARRFARRYLEEPDRGYGQGAHRLLSAIAEGTPWHIASSNLFGGSGSYGNGAAMRVAPLGAFFADAPELVVEQARRSAEVTHSHTEGVAGAIAVAAAAALVAREGKAARGRLLEEALRLTPSSEVATLLERARLLDVPTAEGAAFVLGSGGDVSAQDTVPFVLWCADRWLDDFEEAMWNTVAGLGDRDTTCAMVGGLVALAVGLDGIPRGWREAREPLP